MKKAKAGATSIRFRWGYLLLVGAVAALFLMNWMAGLFAIEFILLVGIFRRMTRFRRTKDAATPPAKRQAEGADAPAHKRGGERGGDRIPAAGNPAEMGGDRAGEC